MLKTQYDTFSKLFDIYSIAENTLTQIEYAILLSGKITQRADNKNLFMRGQ